MKRIVKNAFWGTGDSRIKQHLILGYGKRWKDERTNKYKEYKSVSHIYLQKSEAQKLCIILGIDMKTYKDIDYYTFINQNQGVK